MTIVKTLKDYIVGLQHVGHVVARLEDGIESFCQLYGVDPASVRRVPADSQTAAPTRFAFVSVGDTEFELIEAVDEPFKTILAASPAGGGGINHVAWRVSDLDACLVLLSDIGIRPGHVTPDGPVDFSDRRMVYLDPQHCNGLLVELIQIRVDE